MSTRSITVTVVAAAVLAVGGGTALAMGAGADRSSSTMTLASSRSQPTGSPTAPATPPAGTTIDRGTAERTAIQVAGGGVVTKSELDDRDDDGDPREWEVDVRNGSGLHEIEMNAVTGEVTEHDQDGLRDDDGRDDRDDDRGGDDRGDDKGGNRIGDDRGAQAQGDDDRFDDNGGDRDDRGDD
ncbi:PepSY domain-containing protein [Pseudonocardia endophytica]|uniref:PepSY domain-containing protein n=1 Tax=Pseudonocardia endophytica TaxID=401976 RepID=UPI00104DDF92|nr:PepSY domain-containing protein [Pseudonocardia endophytica]